MLSGLALQLSRPMANLANESRQDRGTIDLYPLDATATVGTIQPALRAIGVPVLTVMPKRSRPVLLRRGGCEYLRGCVTMV